MKKILAILFYLISTTFSFAQQYGADGDLLATGNYGIVKARNLRGGYLGSVYDTVARNAIPLTYRDSNMLVYTRLDSTLWMLKGGIQNSNWTVFSSSNSSTNIGNSNLRLTGNRKLSGGAGSFFGYSFTYDSLASFNLTRKSDGLDYFYVGQDGEFIIKNILNESFKVDSYGGVLMQSANNAEDDMPTRVTLSAQEDTATFTFSSTTKIKAEKVNPNNGSSYKLVALNDATKEFETVASVNVDTTNRTTGIRSNARAIGDSTVLAAAINAKPNFGDIRDIINDSLEIPYIGTLINETFSNKTNFTETGTATFTIVSNALVVATGPGSLVYTNYARQTAYGTTNLEDWQITFNETVGTITSTSFGIGVGIKSTCASTQFDLSAFINLSSDSQGILSIYSNGQTVSSNVALTVSAGNFLNCTFKRSKNVYIFTVFNTNTNVSQSVVFPIETGYILPTAMNANAGNFTIFALGGIHTIDNFVVTSQQTTNSILFIGDSITFGYNTQNTNGRAVDVLNKTYTNYFTAYAQPGNTTGDFSTTEILALKPKKIIINLGINNIAGLGQSAATAFAALQTLINSITALTNPNTGDNYEVGTDVFICTILPRTSILATVQTFNTSIRNTYTTAVIELERPFLNVGSTAIDPLLVSDNTATAVHPNDRGNQLIAEIVGNFAPLGLTKKVYAEKWFTPVVKNYDMTVSLGNLFTRGSQQSGSRAALEVIHSSNSNQIKFSQSTNGNGGTLTSNVNGIVVIGSNTDYINGSYIARSTTPASLLIDGTNPRYIFQANTGATSGNTFTPTAIANISTTGLSVGGGATPSIYRGDFISSATQLRWGTTTSDNGGYLISNGAGSAGFSNAENLGGGSFRAKAANIGVMSVSGGFWSLFLNNQGITSGNTYTATERARMTPQGWYLGFDQAMANPTAKLHIAAGTTTASTGQIKLENGVNPTVAENGLINRVGDNVTFTAGGVVHTFAKTLTATATLDFPSTSANGINDLTITVTGAADGDVVMVGVPSASATDGTYFGFVSATNTVTVRFHNSGGGSHDPASGTFRVSIIKY